jgi:hypothetical protein
VIFLTNKDPVTGEYDVFPAMGDSLGELTNELKSGTYITKFITTGPKSYAYRCSDGEEVVKFKGLTLNHKNQSLMNFEAVLNLLLERNSKVKLKPGILFIRDKYNGRIFTGKLNKTASCTFDKRIVTEDFVTVPYGFHFSER